MHEIAISRAPPSQAISLDLQIFFENQIKSDACGRIGSDHDEDGDSVMFELESKFGSCPRLS
ncbi:hypothetical protein [Martelella mediterranea]|uniref:hypothetical protein n=1 Tax=Martelella mediterranea TaxID=293089 RepID=UPI00104BD772|nr:hypothetical protein [Martelella mediterranea]